MTNQTTTITLKHSQIRFVMDVLMGCPQGHTKLWANMHKVDDAEVYNQLKKCLPDDTVQQ